MPKKNTEVQKQPLKAKNRKFHTYSNTAVESALRCIRDSRISIREASACFGIPRATIHDKLSGKSPAMKKKTGPPPILTVEGEKKIADWAIKIAKCGFPISKSDLIEAVTKIATDTGKLGAFPNGSPGVRWYKGFLKRHPEISQREAEGINKARALVTEELIRSWFEDLKKFLKENNFEDVLEDPARVFNGDESGFAISPKTGKVLGPKGWKNLYVIKSGKEKENITVLIVFNAAGKICPPLVVFPYVRPPRALIENVPDSWVIGKSDSGWMRGDVFYEYIANDFNSWLNQNEVKRPIILFIDGHRSHMTLPLSQFCEQNGIILYALPPNTTHILQPADVSVFKPMKQEWKKTVKDWQSRPENVNQVITKINFCKVFQETLQNTRMENHITKGFRKCGLYPLNPDCVDYTKCVKNFLEKQQQNYASCASEQQLTTKDFDTAQRVIEKISGELEKYGISSNVVINEINFARKSLELNSVDSTPSSITSVTAPTHCNSETALNVEVGSFVPMKSLTVLPIDIIEIRENSLSEDYEAISRPELGQQQSETPFSTLKELLQNETTQNCEHIDNVETSTTEKQVEIAIDVVSNEYIDETQCNCSVKTNMKKTTEGGKNEKEDIQMKKYMTAEKDETSDGITGTEPDNTLPPALDETQGNKSVVLKSNDKTEYSCSFLVDEAQSNKNVILNDKMDDSSSLVDETHANENVIINGKMDDNSSILIDETQANVDGKKDTIIKNDARALRERNNEEFTNVAIADRVEEKLAPNDSLDPFQKHLTFPEEFLKKKTEGRSKEKLPSAISSGAWRTHYTRKDDEKNNKSELARARREKREKERIQKQSELGKKGKRAKVTAKNKENETKRVVCALCEEELISEAEDDEDKNIGCDECPLWFHLKCTDMSDLTYDEAAKRDYVCDMCR